VGGTLVTMSAPERRELPALGPRGEGWVAIQVVLLVLLGIATVLGTPWPDALRIPMLIVAVAIGPMGAVLFVGGMFRLGAQLTPFPKPVEGGTLRDDGVYRFARHPIYGGVVLLASAWTLVSSYLGVVPTILLGLLFEVKSRREELWLLAHHEGYEDYRRRVRHRFVPYVW
jgi:protein-S-isoprenylcysteine O-methyltransferase Ste14